VESLFTILDRACGGSAPAALAAAAAWGVLSLVLSPCHLASIPLIVGFLGAGRRLGPARGAGLAASFAAGLVVTIAAVGALTAAAGRMLGDLGAAGTWIVAAVFLVVGLHLLGLLPLPLPAPGTVRARGRGAGPAFLLGLVFGLALGPCTFAFMAPLLGVVFAVAGERPVYAFFLLLAYAAGHAALIVAAGSAAGAVQRALEWNERRGGLTILRRVCGLLVLAAGAWLLLGR